MSEKRTTDYDEPVSSDYSCTIGGKWLVFGSSEAIDYAMSLQARIAELEEERLRFYHSDGTHKVLASLEEVVRRRIACAQHIENLEATMRDIQTLITEAFNRK